MLITRILLLTAFALTSFSLSSCAYLSANTTPPGMRPFPTEVREQPMYSLNELAGTIRTLNPFIGKYPPAVMTDEQWSEVLDMWTDAFVDARAYMTQAGNAERVLWTMAELSRQGHNIDVHNAGFTANETLQKCLTNFPHSMVCHRSAIEYYHSIRPTEESLKNLERSLVYLRKRLAPKADESVEEKFISLYAYKGQKDEAIKQIDRVLKLFPKNKNRPDLIRFRGELKG